MDDCLRVVQQQERLHRAELNKWQEIVHSVTALLKQSETALGTLQVRTEFVLPTGLTAAVAAAVRSGDEGEARGGGSQSTVFGMSHSRRSCDLDGLAVADRFTPEVYMPQV